jgi:peptide/nickel transport system ATP-binding protein/oligopeptide transport system ATP-binding protein
MTDDPILRVKGLTKHFTLNDGVIDRLLGATKTVQAVNDVSFEVERGDVFGLVGESGCGKSTTARSVLQLDVPTDGSVYFEETDLTEASSKEVRDLRKEMQIIFQDPASSLNRRKSIGQIVRQPMRIHGLYEGRQQERVNELLDMVGIPPSYSNRHPHQFSGGQRQRVGIARALAVDPEFIVADEPVSALDVSIQAQILNLLNDLQEELDLTMLFIAHDLSVIKHICDRVGVMYLGEMVETADVGELFSNPQHPYTKSLLRAIPEPIPELARDREPLSGEIPSPMNPPSGCSFHPRCPAATKDCTEIDPVLEQVEGATAGHRAACIHVESFEKGGGVQVGETDKLTDRYSVENFEASETASADDD